MVSCAHYTALVPCPQGCDLDESPGVFYALIIGANHALLPSMGARRVAGRPASELGLRLMSSTDGDKSEREEG